MTTPKCIHTYLTVCKTNPQPPGFADFLRGSIALYNLCDLYKFVFFLNGNHPVFKYLKESPYIKDFNIEVQEILCTIPYSQMGSIVRNLFLKGESFSVMTHMMYNPECNFGPINPKCKEFFKTILMPNEELEKAIDLVGLPPKFSVIHLRLGDLYIHNDVYNEQIFQLVDLKIKELLERFPEKTFVLVADASKMAIEFKKKNAKLFYWENKKIHLGDLKGGGIKDTLVDFFILSKADEIFVHGYSGFSMVTSYLYDIPYHMI